jgi:hypothetical protein
VDLSVENAIIKNYYKTLCHQKKFIGKA